MLPDHYRTLGIPPDAPADAVKKAYRALARRYHPDAAPEDPYAAARFRAVQEAYAVLSDAAARRRYDTERWLHGGFRRRSGDSLTAATLLRDARTLTAHLRRVSSDDLSHPALRDVLLFLLTDEHLALLRAPDAAGDAALLVEEVLPALKRLHPRYVPEIAERLLLVLPGDGHAGAHITAIAAKARRAVQWERRLPWIVLGMAVVLCLAIWLLGRLG